ncbi:BadF/BadG/BcrA/BcrD ATPase family protein [Myceligenerans pegani]|uniref:ATPase n=1 Tax=Myceligenerans pegani TaxID=2776917 RepID=A0ABR9N6W2_9MICO|nr:BadF/BadG/BcrA/BcrD ATPase family protein [Myceligenerans sp. TRM 65318]MBE1878946.1 ATPase [Myceligenerans sp. TRM 65318]MBE3021217.1 ATPase [Myceligenerans sp. TRM 65318]
MRAGEALEGASGTSEHGGVTVSWEVGIDIGGTGSRLRGAPVGPDAGSIEPIELTGDPVRVVSRRSDAPDVVGDLCRRFAEKAGPATTAAAAVGMRGLRSMTLSRTLSPFDVHDAITGALGTRRTAVASDTITAHLGALQGRSGATLNVGSGAVAIGDDDLGRLHIADGLGPLIGDNGGGSWIGEEGLRAAARASYHDTRGSRRLLEEATEILGPPETWESKLRDAPDRVRVLAEFAPVVVRAAAAGDIVCQGILAGSAELLTDCLAAVLGRPGVRQVAATTGSLMALGSPLRAAVHGLMPVKRVGVELVDAAGTPLDGALLLARRLVEDPEFPSYRPLLTVRTAE